MAADATMATRRAIMKKIANFILIDDEGIQWYFFWIAVSRCDQ